MDADGSNQQRLTDNIYEDWRPDWSPDGTQLVFPSLRNGNYDIIAITADGSNERRITQHGANDIQPNWFR
jgi:TolB protein